MYFPVEMVLMVKAIVTFEGVGQLLLPGFDVAKVSQKHINRIFINQFSPFRMARESLRGAPELVDALVKMPMLVTQGLRALDKATQAAPREPLRRPARHAARRLLHRRRSHPRRLPRPVAALRRAVPARAVPGAAQGQLTSVASPFRPALYQEPTVVSRGPTR